MSTPRPLNDILADVAAQERKVSHDAARQRTAQRRLLLSTERFERLLSLTARWADVNHDKGGAVAEEEAAAAVGHSTIISNRIIIDVPRRTIEPSGEDDELPCTTEFVPSPVKRAEEASASSEGRAMSNFSGLEANLPTNDDADDDVDVDVDRSPHQLVVGCDGHRINHDSDDVSTRLEAAVSSFARLVDAIVMTKEPLETGGRHHHHHAVREVLTRWRTADCLAHRRQQHDEFRRRARDDHATRGTDPSVHTTTTTMTERNRPVSEHAETSRVPPLRDDAPISSPAAKERPLDTPEELLVVAPDDAKPHAKRTEKPPLTLAPIPIVDWQDVIWPSITEVEQPGDDGGGGGGRGDEVVVLHVHPPAVRSSAGSTTPGGEEHRVERRGNPHAPRPQASARGIAFGATSGPPASSLDRPTADVVASSSSTAETTCRFLRDGHWSSSDLRLLTWHCGALPPRRQQPPPPPLQRGGRPAALVDWLSTGDSLMSVNGDPTENVVDLRRAIARWAVANGLLESVEKDGGEGGDQATTSHGEAYCVVSSGALPTPASLVGTNGSRCTPLLLTILKDASAVVESSSVGDAIISDGSKDTEVHHEDGENAADGAPLLLYVALTFN